MNTQRVAAAVRMVDGVASVSEWTRVAGRERVYFSLVRYNGVSHELVSGQVGAEGYFDNDGHVYLKSGPQHQATVDYHRSHGTMKAIGEAGRAVMNNWTVNDL